ncbi:MAG: sulfate transporter CysZ [Pseudomonadales bacterium]
MENKATGGFHYLVEGFSLARTPGIRPFVIIPLCINMALFGGLLYWGYTEVLALNDYLLGYIPDWLSWLTWLLWPLFLLLALVFVMYGFSVIANLIASPFNGILAEQVEKHLTGQDLPIENNWQKMLLLVPKSILRELKKMAYYLPWLILAIIITVIPGINVIAPVVWFGLNAWMMAIQYLDYPMDNNERSFAQLKTAAGNRRMTSLSFGGSVMLVTMVPLMNLFIMPVAICGATAWWVKERELLEPGFNGDAQARIK